MESMPELHFFPSGFFSPFDGDQTDPPGGMVRGVDPVDVLQGLQEAGDRLKDPNE